jgi:hypothetical protein
MVINKPYSSGEIIAQTMSRARSRGWPARDGMVFEHWAKRDGLPKPFSCDGCHRRRSALWRMALAKRQAARPVSQMPPGRDDGGLAQDLIGSRAGVSVAGYAER